MSTNIRGCLLVGSVPLANNEEVFRECLAGMPSRLKRLPDGETGNRYMFTLWQSAVFQVAPEMLLNYALDSGARSRTTTEDEVDEIVAKLEKAGIETEYDTAAIESYAVFKKLREEGVIPQDVKFQVGLPSVGNVVPVFIEKAFQAKVWPLYEQALFRAIRNIQDKISHHDLAIQLDLALDSAFWEGQFLRPAFADTHNVKEYVAEYTLRMIEQIDPEVELGIHNCYGDIEHKALLRAQVSPSRCRSWSSDFRTLVTPDQFLPCAGAGQCCGLPGRVPCALEADPAEVQRAWDRAVSWSHTV